MSKDFPAVDVSITKRKAETVDFRGRKRLSCFSIPGCVDARLAIQSTWYAASTRDARSSGLPSVVTDSLCSQMAAADRVVAVTREGMTTIISRTK
jgi:hypothetical protein